MSAVASQLAEVMREVQKDCKADALSLDGSVINGRLLGEAFGNTLAMLAAVARAVEVLAEQIDSIDRVLNDRTAHLV